MNKKAELKSIPAVGMQALELLRDKLMDEYKSAIVFTQLDIVVLPRQYGNLVYDCRTVEMSQEVLIEACFWYLQLSHAAQDKSALAPKVSASVIFENIGGKVLQWNPLIMDFHLENTSIRGRLEIKWYEGTPVTDSFYERTAITSIFNRFTPATITVRRK